NRRRPPRLPGGRVSDVLAFAKYHATGNDFLIVDDLDGSATPFDVPALCDRWTGVGADGVIRVTVGSTAPFRFHLTNADGSVAAMSGNGLRCLGAYLRGAGGLGGAGGRARAPAR